MPAPCPAPVRPAARAWGALVAGLRLAQLPVVGVALLLCLRGQGKVLNWVVLGCAVPLLRLALDPCFRHRARDGLAALWESAWAYTRKGGPLPWRAAFALVTLPSALLFLSNNRTVGWGDSWPVVPTAASLVRQGDWEIGEYAGDAPAGYRVSDLGGLPYCVVRTGGGLYSSYPAGMVPLAVPVAAAARLAGADLDSPAVQNRLEKWTAAWVAALALGLFFLTALHLGGPPAAWLTTAFLAAGSVMFSTVA